MIAPDCPMVTIAVVLEAIVNRPHHRHHLIRMSIDVNIENVTNAFEYN